MYTHLKSLISDHKWFKHFYCLFFKMFYLDVLSLEHCIHRLPINDIMKVLRVESRCFRKINLKTNPIDVPIIINPHLIYFKPSKLKHIEQIQCLVKQFNWWLTKATMVKSIMMPPLKRRASWSWSALGSLYWQQIGRINDPAISDNKLRNPTLPPVKISALFYKLILYHD